MRSMFGRLLGILAAAAGLGACDSQGRFIEERGLDKLEPGVSRESDVRVVFGQPDAIITEPDGTRVLQYPRGPAGPRTWFFELDRDGTLKGWRQVLTPENFARVEPGMDREQVRRMLGRPRSVVPFRLKNEEVWDWTYLEGHTPQLFNVHFDMGSGKVVRTSTTIIDPERPTN